MVNIEHDGTLQRLMPMTAISREADPRQNDFATSTMRTRGTLALPKIDAKKYSA